MIVPNLADPFTSAAVQAVQEIARENGHAVILASSGGDVDLEESELKIMLRRQIDGVVLMAQAAARATSSCCWQRTCPLLFLTSHFEAEKWTTSP